MVKHRNNEYRYGLFQEHSAMNSYLAYVIGARTYGNPALSRVDCGGGHKVGAVLAARTATCQVN